jgi:hypothetical protein
VEGNADPVIWTVPPTLVDAFFATGSTLLTGYAIWRGFVKSYLRWIESARHWPFIGGVLRETDADEFAESVLRQVNWPELHGVPKGEVKTQLKEIAKENPRLNADLISDREGKQKLLNDLERRGVRVNGKSPSPAAAPPQPSFDVDR